ncbi:TPA: hypothetical protein U1D16_002282 [Streptococcus suis]|nr:hypothetical protein [Streptococcus suis]HEM3726810.1 hypothetical protein [Streptococcus suis]
MRNQNNLRNKEQNVIFARGKIIELNNGDTNPSFILFVRNGAARKHTYLTFEYDSNKFHLKKGTVVSITAHIENTGTQNNCVIITDSVQNEQTELATFFNKQSVFGFAYPKPFAKLFVFGKVIDKHLKPNSNWIEMIIEDNCKNRIKVQYSTKMRVNDTKLNTGDKVYAYALPISTQKLVNEEIVNFETFVAEDIVIEQ